MNTYTILPFRFAHFNEDEYLLTNDVGEYIFLSNSDFDRFINLKLDTKSELFMDIASKQIATTDKVEDVVNMLATKFRTKKSILQDFTTLHMVVPTLRCNSSCIYCQVKRHESTDHSADMTKLTAKNIVKTIFESPSPCIKIEFQGGDPSTDFEMVRYIIEEAEWENLFKKKDLSFVICTNLTLINEKMVKYLKKHNCLISTSLDGPKDLHDKNRPLQDKNLNHHELFERNLRMIRKIWDDNECVSALMTTSKYSLGRFKDIVDEYIRLGFNSLFFRALNPYGFAKEYKNKVSYSVEEFIDNFKEGLDYIIELNKKGIFFIEGYSALLLKRMLTPFATGFVDLQSPAGVGIAGAIYDYDGSVYVADEGRMMARFKNYYFRLGNVNENTHQEMFNGEKLHSIIHSACTECLPECAECVFQPYCGADPVRNLSEQKDIIGHRPTNEMCKKNKAIIHYLFELIKKNDPNINRVFWSWIN
ncbi:MAG: His-Xaa-Ser system radical SAM maturase HxsB [Bacteroidaceae bacterium]|nr:His-Xaa-Ser system radical SAM maturase HxsB [Bacteroidaceae bacterium]